MKITKLGSDLMCVSESEYNNKITVDHKVHLVKLDFEQPTSEKVFWAINTFQHTNRFIISDNISFYNSYLKHTNKKYYIVNSETNKLISFYKKNNKVLLDITKLSEFEKQFVLNVVLSDILMCTEVVAIKKADYMEHTEEFNNWNGNLIVLEEGETL